MHRSCLLLLSLEFRVILLLNYDVRVSAERAQFILAVLLIDQFLYFERVIKY